MGLIEKRFWKGIIVIICFALGLSITGCSNQSTIKSFGPQQAAGQGDVVNDHGQVYNIDKLAGFLDSVDHGIVSKLRMIDYTTEGDPVIHVLAYNGQTIDFSTDNSQDKFAEPIKAITHQSFSKIIKDTQSPSSYYLLDSSGNKQLLLTVTKIFPSAQMKDITANQPGYSSKYPKVDISNGSTKINWVRSTANYTSQPDGVVDNSNFGLEMDDAMALPADVVKPGARIDFKAAEVMGLDKPSYKVQLVDENKEFTDYPVDNHSIVAPYYSGEYLFNLEITWGNGNHQIFYWFKVNTEKAIEQIGLKINDSLPSGWNINLNGDKEGQILKNGKVVGRIEMVGYYGDNSSLPNHSSIVRREDIVSGLGKAKMYILARDMPAASPEQRTWTELYVVAPISDSSLAFGVSIETDDFSMNSDREAMRSILQSLALK